VTNWLTPQKETVKLGSNSLHLWKLDLDHPADGQKHLLSTDELTRLASIQGSDNQHRFLKARSGLRLVLSHYLEVDAQSIVFGYEKLGKPILTNNPFNLQFNLSHSAGQALVVVRNEYKVGVDIEPVKARPTLLRIARRVLDKEVCQQLEILEEPERIHLFTQQWTRMEALSKTQGGGVFTSLDPSHPLNAHSWTPYPDWYATVASEGTLPDFADWSFYSASTLFTNKT